MGKKFFIALILICGVLMSVSAYDEPEEQPEEGEPEEPSPPTAIKIGEQRTSRKQSLCKKCNYSTFLHINFELHKKFPLYLLAKMYIACPSQSITVDLFV